MFDHRMAWNVPFSASAWSPLKIYGLYLSNLQISLLEEQRWHFPGVDSTHLLFLALQRVHLDRCQWRLKCQERDSYARAALLRFASATRLVLRRIAAESMGLWAIGKLSRHWT